MKISSVLLALPLALAACGGDDGVTPVDIDAGEVGPDACVAAKPAAPGAVMLRKGEHLRLGDGGGGVAHGGCQATATYGAATAAQQFSEAAFAECTTTNPEDIVYEGSLNADPSPDLFALQLYKGYGVFSSGEIRTGTYNLTGDETQFADCGVCALIFADIDTTNGMIGSRYMATGGTVTITSVSPNLTGSVSNLTFTHVDIDDQTFISTPNADGCPSAITSLSFDVAVGVAE